MAYETTDQLIAEAADHWNKRHDTVFYNLIDIFNQYLGKIDDNGKKIADWTELKNAEGTTLDLIGQDYKAYRISDDDETFRFIIFIHILMSHAQGTIPSMVKIMSTSLQAPADKFKVYKTGLRHVGMEIPWDYVKTYQMQKFIVKNIQRLLAMGYWIDEIKWVISEKLDLYIGNGVQSKWQYDNYANVVWWTGWKTRTSMDLYFGNKATYRETDKAAADVVWWTGWKTKTSTQLYIAVTGTMISTELYSADVIWSQDKHETVHTGLNIGNKISTTTTQSIKTE